MLDRKTPPQAGSIDHIEIAQATSEQLNNGIPIHILQAGAQEVVRIEFIFKAGNWFESKKGISFFTTKMLGEGTKTKNAREITNYIDKYGAFLDLESSVDYSMLTVYSLTKHLPDILPLLQEMIYESTFPQSELEIVKKIKKQKIRLNKQKNNIVAGHKFREVLYGKNHPYGRFLEEDEIDAFTKEKIETFFNSSIVDNFEIIISGKITPNILELINNTFGSHIVTDSNNKVENKIHPGDKKVLIEKEESMQSSIRIGKRLFKKSHPDFIGMQVVNEILGGYFGSRLMKNIREDKGFTYGISSSILSLKHDGFFILGTDVKKEYTDKTLEETYKEINILSTESIEENELSTVKNYMLGSFLASINNPFSLADKFKSIYFNELDYDYYDQFIHTVKNITPEEIKTLTQKHLNTNTLHEVVVGGKLTAE